MKNYCSKNYIKKRQRHIGRIKCCVCFLCKSIFIDRKRSYLKRKLQTLIMIKKDH